MMQFRQKMTDNIKSTEMNNFIANLDYMESHKILTK